jgi:prevent-host-death family protein
MKSVAMSDAASNLDAVLKSAQQERVVLTRNGKPSAVVVGIESYDDEDFRLARSAEFWQMIESRRHSGREIPLAELKRRIGVRSKKQPSTTAARGQQKGRRKTSKR